MEKVKKLNDYIVSAWDPKMKWMWGEALYGYSLALLDEHWGTDKYTPFLKAYCDHYAAHPPKIHSSDTAAPALITYAMQKKTGCDACKKLTDRVVDYIMNEPRLLEDSVNHMGTNWVSKWYPKSVWVDSIMMFALFPCIYAVENGDDEMLTVAARQVRVLAKYLMDEKDNLWYHAYWVKQRTHYPKSPIYWGRGNGWVVAAIPMMLERLPENHPERAAMVDIFRRTCHALLPCQREDGSFETILKRPGKTYRELSATALIASGFLSGHRQGLLEASFLEAALRAYACCADSIGEKQGTIELPEISGPTIPVPGFPYLGYKLIPRKSNWSYGLAAFNFASIEHDKRKRE